MSSPPPTLYARVPNQGDGPDTPDAFPRPGPYQMSDPSRRVSQHSLPPVDNYDKSSMYGGKESYPPTVSYGESVYPDDHEARIPLTHGGHGDHEHRPGASLTHRMTKRIQRMKPRSFIERLSGKGREIPGVWPSIVRFTFSSWMNGLIFFVPLSWVSHFLGWSYKLTFAFSVLALVPLEKMMEYLGEELAMYCGHAVGDFIFISLHNAVEAILALILLNKCYLRLLQSTVIGVILLHLLFVPGTAFLTGGSKIFEQLLLERPTQLNQSLMTAGVLTVLVPAAIFSVLHTPAIEYIDNTAALPGKATAAAYKRATSSTELTLGPWSPLNDVTRGQFVDMSRGLAIILLVIYIASRIFLHNPPTAAEESPAVAINPRHSTIDLEIERKLHEETEHHKHKINPWVCVVFLIILVGLLATTCEWLVLAVLKVVGYNNITEEWTGLILLPFASFVGDGLVAIVFFIKKLFRLHPEAPEELAKGRDIDTSVQFLMMWVPLLVLVAWGLNMPLSLLFDMYEIVVLIGSCFLVNSITQDHKTNWAEGLIMVCFYIVIALSAWFYHGQVSHSHMVACKYTVQQSIANGGDYSFGPGRGF